MMVKVMYTLTFHRLLWSILNVCSPRETKTIQKRGIWSFLRHLTLIFYLYKVTKTIFPQVISDVKFPALFKSATKNRGSRLRNRSYLHLTLKIDVKVKIDGTVKCPSRSWSTFVEPFFRRWSISEDIWDYRLKWVTVYMIKVLDSNECEVCARAKQGLPSHCYVRNVTFIFFKDLLVLCKDRNDPL